MAGITHSWNGTILTITSDSGTSSCDLKGAKGDDGARGAMGLPGDANLIDAVDKAEKAAADAETALNQLGTARDEAVAAAAQVKAIVAGNEAYTKAESDSRFANAIKPTATGEIATANDSGNYPLQGLSIYGKTTQAGTPTPISPIDLVNCGSSGSIGVKVCGKNLLKVISTNGAWNGISFTTNSNGSISVKGTATDLLALTITETDFIPAGKYKLLPGRYGRAYIDVIANNIQIVQSQATQTMAFTINEGDNAYARLIVPAGETIDAVFYPAIYHYSVNDLSYEPYKDGGSITLNTPNGLPGIPVSSDGNYTDSNGQQWIADEIDLAAGVYRQRVKQFSLSQVETWAKWGEHWYNHNYLQDSAATYNSILGVCSHVERLNNYINAAYMPHSDIVNGRGVGIQISNAASSWGFTGNTPEEFKEFIANKDIKLVYACIPTETALTTAEIAAFKALQSQYPYTTVYSDANAGIAATYVADTKLYIDNKFNELSTALVAMGG